LERFDDIIKEKGLRQRINYSIRRKNTKKNVEFYLGARYGGPDRKTLDLLEKYANTWEENPSLFWTGRLEGVMMSLETQAQIVGSYLRTIQDDE
jgi:hypothetical protein